MNQLSRSTAVRQTGVSSSESAHQEGYTEIFYVDPDGGGTHTTFALAYAAASSDANAYTLINFSAGTFDLAIANYFTLAKKIHIKGSGSEQTIFRNSQALDTADAIFYINAKVKISDCGFNNAINGGCSGILLNSSNGNGSVLKDLLFNFSTPPKMGYAIRINGVDRVTVKDIVIKGNWATDTGQIWGIGVTEGINNIFENIRIYDCIKGIYFTGDAFDDNIFRNIDIWDCAIGIDHDAGDGNLLQNIHLQRCAIGIDIESSANNNSYLNITYGNCTSNVFDSGTETIWEVIQSLYEQELYVAKDGSNADGLSWATAYTSLASAITAASTTKFCLINAGAGIWDVASGTYLTLDEEVWIKGAGKNVTIFRNSQGAGGSDAIFFVTDRVKISDCTFRDDGASGKHGIVFSGIGANGSEVENVHFDFKNSPHVGSCIHIKSSASDIHVNNCSMKGDVDSGGQITAISLQGNGDNHFDNIDIGHCFKGINIDAATSDENDFHNFHIHDCTLGINIDYGNDHIFHDIELYGNTTNIDDEVGDSHWLNINGQFKIESFPQTATEADLEGVTVADGAGNTYGSYVEIISAAENDAPFVIVGVTIEAEDAGRHGVRLSADGGTSFFYEVVIDFAAATAVRTAISLPAGTEYIFNKGTQITAAWQSSDGNSEVNKINLQRQYMR